MSIAVLPRLPVLPRNTKGAYCIWLGTVSYTHLDVYKRQLGGSIDELFYWKKLAVDNTPTFGTSGILWACLLYTSRCV